jgi:hypothetical protein
MIMASGECRFGNGSFKNPKRAALIQYRVVVRGQGVVHHGEDLAEANRRYTALVAQAKIEGRRTGDPVRNAV